MKVSFSSAAAHFAAAAIVASVLMTTQPAIAQQNGDVDQAQIDLGQIDLGQIDLGKATFAAKCSHCHGPNMVNAGTITPDLRRFPDDRERFVTTVKSGKNGKMPPWGDILSEDDITHLWAYISSQRKP
jgi:mono/diheme cytochrome c family protein